MIRFEERPQKPLRKMVAVAAVCDCCGGDAYYPAHHGPGCVLIRVRDDGRSNQDMWRLDLCQDCKDEVLEQLRARARTFDRELPQASVEEFPGVTGGDPYVVDPAHR